MNRPPKRVPNIQCIKRISIHNKKVAATIQREAYLILKNKMKMKNKSKNKGLFKDRLNVQNVKYFDEPKYSSFKQYF